MKNPLAYAFAASFLFAPRLGAVPLAAGDRYSVREEGMLSVGRERGLLVNDTGDGNPLGAVLQTPPANGRVTVNADGTFHYVPNGDFTGTDSFTYVAREAGGTQIFTVNQAVVDVLR